MNSAFAILGSAFVFLAALVHLMIFFMESVLWHTPRVRQIFGVRNQTDADIIKPWAYNQGFYNAFLALGAGTGLVLMGSTNLWPAGIALAMFATLSMLLAAIVLITSQPKMARAAAIQGVPPLLGIISLVLALNLR
ncbi:membrane protein [marine actinobacterium PHSC20C1]|nr:membrane protein [marine actinobacterium PHSC20C1]